MLHKSRLLSDNGPCCIAGDPAEYLEEHGYRPCPGRPHHLRTQGKIERRHQILKNCILLENDCLQGKLEAAIAAPVEPCDNRRYHESPGNLTPADVCSERGPAILAERKRIRKPTIQIRRLLHQGQAA